MSVSPQWSHSGVDRNAQHSAHRRRGIVYTNFHTTALCSPSRSCFLTGRNHTTNGMGTITEAASGFPSQNGHIPFECGTLAEVLGERGWNTYTVGKWHLTPEDEMNLASIKTQWPLGRGFERFYGFLGAETNQWYPDLVYDNHPVEQPRSPDEGYHFTTDITDKALEFIRDAKSVAPDKPFFLYFCPGACHAPHHAPKEWADRYQGKFDMGYEAYRELVFDRQKMLGILPEQAELSPINPYIDEKSPDGTKGWSELDLVRPWDSLSDDERRLFCRMAEVYAGFLSHADHEIGRLLDYLEDSGQLENTLIVLVSDNGASGEGGPNGSVNENKMFNGLPDRIEENLPFIDDLGGPRTYNHYPTGWAWAFNTPFKLWKRYANWEGGTADPMIVSWPVRITQTGCPGSTRMPLTSCPTIYEGLAIDPPEVVKGYTQYPLEGVSFAATFADLGATTGKQTQFYSMGGTRAIWHKGWKAAAVSPSAPDMWGDYANHAGSCSIPKPTPPSATIWPQHPDRLQELIALWWNWPVSTGPCRSRTGASRDPPHRASPDRKAPQPLRLLPGRRRGSGVGRPQHSQPLVHDRGGATIDSPDAAGVLLAQGSRFGGHALYIKDGKLKYVYNWVGLLEQVIESTVPIPHRAGSVLRLLRKRGRHHAHRGHPHPAHRRDPGRPGPHQNAAGQVLDRRRRPQHRQGRRRARHRRLPGPGSLGPRWRHRRARHHRRQRPTVRRSGHGGRAAFARD